MAHVFNRHIPDAAHQAMLDISSRGISVVAFGQNGAWVVASPDG